ncbi:MAG: hypothetical protein QOG96_5695 [Pseudonocardiales bacterium]|nr:hypothetical protein [Pseudonocardiales bacterium]
MHSSLNSSRILIAGHAVVGTGNRLTALVDAEVDAEVDAPAVPLARASA